MIYNQKGFTFVELVMVLILISLITLGAIKGQALIESAKLNSVIKEFERYEYVTYTYVSIHRSVPGAYRFRKHGKGIVGGWNEAGFWKDLRKEGLIEGDPSDGDAPIEHDLWNSKTESAWQVTVLDSVFAICAKGLLEYAEEIDRKFKDGGDTSYKAGNVYIHNQLVCKDLSIGNGDVEIR